MGINGSDGKGIFLFGPSNEIGAPPKLIVMIMSGGEIYLQVGEVKVEVQPDEADGVAECLVRYAKESRDLAAQRRRSDP